MPEISVIFAAYREPGTVFENVEKIAKESDDVEFIISADEWGNEDIERAKALARKYPITFLHHDKRIGKVNGLNEAIAHSKGKILVFLDNDVEIKGTFIPGVRNAMKRGDVGQGVIHPRGEGFIASGAKLDYLGINATIAIEEMTGIGFGLNGACIIAKREVVEKIGGFRHVITEDSDFGTRANAAGFRPILARDVHVSTGVPDTYKKWFKQRARWAVGEMQTAMQNREYHERHAVETIAQAFTVVPFILPFLIQMIAPGPAWAKLGYWIAAALGVLNPVAPLAAAVLYVLLELTNPFVALANLLLLGLWTWYWRNELKFNEIGVKDVLIYGTVYGPLWLAVLIGATAYTFLKGPNLKEFMGWKA
ncbi:MAG: glycosyltransferase family 2 protein [Candidatus Diapherotrites archaeon]|nr:glycosyltransferase family 2 protein [Candidatus Diapherotrites archaeon]